MLSVAVTASLYQWWICKRGNGTAEWFIGRKLACGSRLPPRFANADFALALALSRYAAAAISLGRAKYFRRILVTYDIACQYFIHLRSRFLAASLVYPEFDVGPFIDIMNMLVPKMHLSGHKDDCKYRFSLSYSDGTGRLHGEGIEPSWGETKQSGGSTQHMNHGHRHDTIIDFHNYWNWCKVRNMSTYCRHSLVYNPLIITAQPTF